MLTDKNTGKDKESGKQVKGKGNTQVTASNGCKKHFGVLLLDYITASVVTRRNIRSKKKKKNNFFSLVGRDDQSTLFPSILLCRTVKLNSPFITSLYLFQIFIKIYPSSIHCIKFNSLNLKITE